MPPVNSGNPLARSSVASSLTAANLSPPSFPHSPTKSSLSNLHRPLFLLLLPPTTTSCRRHSRWRTDRQQKCSLSLAQAIPFVARGGAKGSKASLIPSANCISLRSTKLPRSLFQHHDNNRIPHSFHAVTSPRRQTIGFATATVTVRSTTLSSARTKTPDNSRIELDRATRHPYFRRLKTFGRWRIRDLIRANWLGRSAVSLSNGKYHVGGQGLKGFQWLRLMWEHVDKVDR